MKKILIIRRDNIGDLICTTPLIASIRQNYPDAWVGALVNDYNAQVLNDHPDLNEVFVYTKLKHRRPGEFALAVVWRTWSMVRRLKAMRLDTVVIASSNAQKSALKYALWVKPKQICAYNNDLFKSYTVLNQQKTVEGWGVSQFKSQGNTGAEIWALDAYLGTQGNEVTIIHRLASLLDIHSEPGPLKMVAGASAVGRVSKYFRQQDPTRYRVVIHISGRHPSRRWPVEHWQQFLSLANSVVKAEWVLLWAPGSASEPGHPGDDEKADRLINFAKFSEIPLTPVPTRRLDELIGAMAHADAVVCTDGGAMHVAAAQNKPMVVMFGQTSTERWHPWQVPQTLLQADSREVKDIPPEQTLQALIGLCPYLAR